MSTEGPGKSSEGAVEARGSSMGPCKGAAGGSLTWLLRSRLELLSTEKSSSAKCWIEVERMCTRFRLGNGDG